MHEAGNPYVLHVCYHEGLGVVCYTTGIRGFGFRLLCIVSQNIAQA